MPTGIRLPVEQGMPPITKVQPDSPAGRVRHAGLSGRMPPQPYRNRYGCGMTVRGRPGPRGGMSSNDVAGAAQDREGSFGGVTSALPASRSWRLPTCSLSTDLHRWAAIIANGVVMSQNVADGLHVAPRDQPRSMARPSRPAQEEDGQS